MSVCLESVLWQNGLLTHAVRDGEWGRSRDVLDGVVIVKREGAVLG